MTQQELADALGASRKSIVTWEQMGNQPLPALQQGRVADLLGVNLDTGTASDDALAAYTDMQLISELSKRMADLRAQEGARHDEPVPQPRTQESGTQHRTQGRRTNTRAPRKSTTTRGDIEAWLQDPTTDPVLQGRLSQMKGLMPGLDGRKLTRLAQQVMDTRRQELQAQLEELQPASTG